MNCPKCKDKQLTENILDNGLACLSCQTCHGSLLSIFDYFDWIQKQSSVALDGHIDIKLDNTSHILQCSKCSGLMTKYLISEQSDNRLDMCFRCYEIWFDHGEWQLLKYLNVLSHLPKIFTNHWQENIQHKMYLDHQLSRDKTQFGQHYSRLVQFKQWLDDYSHKDDVMLYLNRHNP